MPYSMGIGFSLTTETGTLGGMSWRLLASSQGSHAHAWGGKSMPSGRGAWQAAGVAEPVAGSSTPNFRRSYAGNSGGAASFTGQRQCGSTSPVRS